MKCDARRGLWRFAPTIAEFCPYMGVWEGRVGTFHHRDAASRSRRFRAGARNRSNNTSSLLGTFLALCSCPAASKPPGKTTLPLCHAWRPDGLGRAAVALPPPRGEFVSEGETSGRCRA